MNRIKFFLYGAAVLIAVSCNNTESTGALAQPGNVTVTPLSGLQAEMTWKDNAKGEVSYSVLLLNVKSELLATLAILPPDSQSFSVKDDALEYGVTYRFGVRADSDVQGMSSPIAVSDFVQFKKEEGGDNPGTGDDPGQGDDPGTGDDPNAGDEPNVSEDPSSPVKITDISATAHCVSISYQYFGVKNITSLGVCWDEKTSPDISMSHQEGPMYKSGKLSTRQVIPNVLLDYGKEYKFRAYAMTSDGTCYYSTSSTCSLQDPPTEIKFNWNDITPAGYPKSVKVYNTTDKLSGRNFAAWYAIADVNAGDIEFKVTRHSELGAATIDQQYEENEGCLVLVNGGYFYYDKGYHHVGTFTIDGNTQGDISTVVGYNNPNYPDDPEKDKTYFVTKGTFGVDYSGKPAVYWTATGRSGWDGNRQFWYYDRPLPTVCSDPEYRDPVSDFPAPSIAWNPKYALSAGPVLLKDGKRPFDFTTTGGSDHYYLNNYELIAYDIFGSGISPDRTAVGLTEDGKIIMFICDGRITESKGATLTELAMIMKGLGCKDALNLDGGGSTGIMLNGNHINHIDATNRAVYTCIGFFRK